MPVVAGSDPGVVTPVGPESGLHALAQRELPESGHLRVAVEVAAAERNSGEFLAGRTSHLMPATNLDLAMCRSPVLPPAPGPPDPCIGNTATGIAQRSQFPFRFPMTWNQAPCTVNPWSPSYLPTLCSGIDQLGIVSTAHPKSEAGRGEAERGRGGDF